MFFQSTRVARLGVLAAVGLLVWNSLFFAGGVRIHPAVVSAQADTTTVRFQQGVAPSAAYAGAADTTLSETNKTSTYGSSASVRVDGDDLPGTGLDLSALLSWNISSIPPGSIIDWPALPSTPATGRPTRSRFMPCGAPGASATPPGTTRQAGWPGCARGQRASRPRRYGAGYVRGRAGQPDGHAEPGWCGGGAGLGG